MKVNYRLQEILLIVKNFIHQQKNLPYLEWQNDYQGIGYEQVTLAIIEAFLDTRLGEGVGFFEADLIDFGEAPTTQKYQLLKNQDERIFWEKNLLLGNSGQRTNHFYPYCANCFMDEKGLIFALPCYLLWEVEGIGKLPASSFDYFAKLPLNSKQKQAFLLAVEFLQNRAFEHNDDGEYDDWEMVKDLLLNA